MGAPIEHKSLHINTRCLSNAVVFLHVTPSSLLTVRYYEDIVSCKELVITLWFLFVDWCILHPAFENYSDVCCDLLGELCNVLHLSLFVHATTNSIDDNG